MRRWGLCVRAIMLVAVCAVLAGCGDRETVAPTQATTTAPALGGIDRLAAEANRTERLLEDRVRALTEIDSLTDVSPRLKGLETELQNAAKAWKALSSRTTSLLCGTAWLKPFAAWRRRSPTRGRTWKPRRRRRARRPREPRSQRRGRSR